MAITAAEKAAIAGMGNVQLEMEIANVYRRAYDESFTVKVQETEGSRIEGLWLEFDRRLSQGIIEMNPWTGNEADFD